jgi:hypothetical protein
VLVVPVVLVGEVVLVVLEVVTGGLLLVPLLLVDDEPAATGAGEPAVLAVVAAVPLLEKEGEGEGEVL